MKRVHPQRIQPGPGQESVWDYPRPPVIESTDQHIQVFFNDTCIVDTKRAFRVLETSSPPVYYLPPQDVQMTYLHPNSAVTFCEWKGRASYFDVRVADKSAVRAAWCYRDPNPDYTLIKNFIAFYASKMDACLLDGERVRPQAGDFYGGWITNNIVGPFKGQEGTLHW